MSSRRGQLPAHDDEEAAAKKPSRCLAAICFSWKVITCVVSHVTLVLLVVSYCVGGAYLFQRLEKPHEIEVKRGIHNMRRNLTDKIWKFSDNVSVLSEADWISSVKLDLVNFEKQILTAMKTDGWDGDEDDTKTQWTFAGSLFYSIIVITTIGYGHIAPRTDWGKVTTIFYAIVGIPLMLLCLSNIGDVMATSFRFIYWRVCCYICTRNNNKRPRRSRQRSVRRYPSTRSQPPPNFRRSMKMTQRSGNDSGIGTLPHAYSDPELRTIGRGGGGGGGDYYDDFRGGSGRRHHHQQSHRSSGGRRFSPPRGGGYDDDYGRYDDDERERGGGYGTQTLNRHAGRYSSRQRNRDQMRERHTVERERYLSRSKQQFGSMDELPGAKRTMSMRSPARARGGGGGDDDELMSPRASREPRELARLNTRGRSVPPRSRAKSADPRAASVAPYEKVDEELVRKTPIIPNRYALDEQGSELLHPHQHQHHQHHHHHQHHNHQQQQQPLNRLRSNGSGGGGSMRSQSMPRNAQHRSSGQREPSVTPSSYGGQRRSSFSRQHSAPQQRYGNRLELPDSHSGGGGRQRQRGRSPRPEPEYDDDYDEYLDFDERDRDVEAGGGGGGYDDDYDYGPPQGRYREPRKRRSERSERLPPSPRIMSPMGFAVKRQVRRRPSYDYDDDSNYGDDWNDYGDLPPKDRPVPIWLCVFLVISYILGGAALFAYWESWSFLDSAYFCFITLTTIGFGDFVPAKGVQDESEQSIAYCSLYLLFGIALLAMSFNLVQEEFIANVKEVAKRLGILKDDEDDD